MSGGPRLAPRWWPLGIALLLAAVGLGAATRGPAAAGLRPSAHRVEIRGFVFRPPTLELTLGDTVVWENRDIVPHAVGAAVGWRSPELPSGGSWRLVPRARGRVPYDCPLHPTMKGTLVVR